MKKAIILCTLVALMSGCSGIRQTNNQFTTHAESFGLLGFTIPANDQEVARSLVPKGATITDVYSTPADWTSLWGFFGSVFGFRTTVISGTK